MNTGDLASRLRGAAETMPTAADRLAATLDRAARLRRRRRQLTVASAAAAVTLVIAVSMLAINRTPDGSTPPPAASPPISGKPGRTVAISAARLAGTSLFVSFIGAPHAAPTDPCWRGYRVEAKETDRTVTLLLREYLPLTTLPPGHGCSRVGYAWILPIRLARSLASRTVVDSSTHSAVSVFRNVLTVKRLPEWTLRAESGQDSSWQQTFQGPAGEFILNQGRRSIGVLTNTSFYQRTGTTTVRGTSAAWGTAPGETSIHWVEGDRGIQILSPDLRVPDLVDITRYLAE